ncbi:MAG TPA: hypothetical protein DDX98_14555 [Bacteroidales bacterium]|jgi:hypothetical protein|nr:hypothetical protein [Bacteroidales bacterium]
MRTTCFIILFLSHFYFPINAQEIHIKPDIHHNIFKEYGRLFAFENENNIIVSIGFEGKLENSLIFDITIDNQSDTVVYFNPSEIYAFCYDTSGSIVAEKMHVVLPADSVLRGLNVEIEKHDKKASNYNLLSMLMGVAYAATDIALASNGASGSSRDLLSVSHLAGQIIVDEVRAKSIEEADKLSHTRYHMNSEIFCNSSINAKSYRTGKIHFTLPESHYYKIYIPVNNQVYSFRFVNSED